MRSVATAGEGSRHFVVHEGALADGVRIADLPLAERAWVEAVYRDGRPLGVVGQTELRPGDGVLVYCELETLPVVRRIFEGRQPVS
jgi:Trk K+ transport system NAD-binding subunit